MVAGCTAPGRCCTVQLGVRGRPFAADAEIEGNGEAEGEGEVEGVGEGVADDEPEPVAAPAES